MAGANWSPRNSQYFKLIFVDIKTFLSFNFFPSPDSGSRVPCMTALVIPAMSSMSNSQNNQQKKSGLLQLPLKLALLPIEVLEFSWSFTKKLTTSTVYVLEMRICTSGASDATLRRDVISRGQFQAPFPPVQISLDTLLTL